MRNAKHFIIVAVLIVISTIILRLLFTWLLALPVAASAQAEPIDNLFNAHFWMIAFLFSLIMVIMLYSAAVFRRKPDDEEDAEHVHGNTALEIGWTIIPTFVVIGFGVWGAFMLNALTTPNPDEIVIEVVGRQWSWTFAYPEYGDFVSTELVIAKDQPVLLSMNSEDVIHSFWIVEFRVKQDVVPGRTTELRITPTLEGDYKLRCAEICGLNHSTMLAPVRIVSTEEFDAWVAEKMAAPKYADMTPAERGALWHSAEGFACAGCHSLDGSLGAGPTWLGIYGRQEALTDGTTISVDDAYINESVTNPNAKIVEGFAADVMPKIYAESFAEKEAEILANEGVEIDIIADLIAFMQTLEE